MLFYRHCAQTFHCHEFRCDYGSWPRQSHWARYTRPVDCQEGHLLPTLHRCIWIGISYYIQMKKDYFLQQIPLSGIRRGNSLFFLSFSTGSLYHHSGFFCIFFNIGGIDILLEVVAVYHNESRRLHNAVTLYQLHIFFRINYHVLFIL